MYDADISFLMLKTNIKTLNAICNKEIHYPIFQLCGLNIENMNEL